MGAFFIIPSPGRERPAGRGDCKAQGEKEERDGGQEKDRRGERDDLGGNR